MNSRYHHSYILDRENEPEMARLELQGHLLTEGMGGLMPELANTLPLDCSQVLDLGCGPGEWVRHLAGAYPQVEITGLDISQKIITYAQMLTRQRHLDNAHFVQGNLLEPLLFADGSFDLLNARLLICVVRQHHWPAFLRECWRLLKPGGKLRLTEGDDPIWQTNKQACQRMSRWAEEIALRCCYGFPLTGRRGLRVKESLCALLKEGGWSKITLDDHLLDCSSDTLLATSQRRNALTVWKQAEPLLLRFNIATEIEFKHTYEAMKREMAEKDFHGVWHMSTVSAEKSPS